VDIDPVTAISWSEMAAVQGEPTAQFVLATLYAKGIKLDLRLADRWLASAASRGNLKAMHNLAIAYLNGEGVFKNPTAAVNWFRKAALAGYRDSAFDLAVLYERGEGVHQDPSLAMQWYNLAASQGDLEAAKRLEFLKTSVTTVYKAGRSP
jgi:localization factor PodJL